ncbi:MAG: FAD-dependent thymidylate synthase [Clostridia bacterium]|nr:FAD-dependent thymidylate synthase [Clostridia bacterium]
MEIKVLASTKMGHQPTAEGTLELAGKMANICYTKRTIDDIFNEPKDTSIGRAKRTLSSGHHSIADHVRYHFGISEIPKMLAMVLNNEVIYSTSEKSARYTEMKPTPREQEKYDKWLAIFSDRIEKEYGEKFLHYQERIAPDKDPQKETKKQITKLAQENARYMISVFTPTIMGHSLDARQLSYLCCWFEKFIREAENTPFNERLKTHMQEFVSGMEPYTIPELKDQKGRKISLFDSRKFRYESFGECYSTSYKATFAELAQAQRHRTLRYTMSFLPKNEFYVPVLIRNDEALKQEWLEDISSLADVFPQGMLVMVNERGTYEDFIQKCSERLCGCAQLEIAMQTQETAKRYVAAVKGKYPELYDILLPYSTKARCQNGWHCDRPCVWGAKESFTRKV